MATLTAALSDEQLSATRLEIDDPLAVPRLSSEKPAADLTPAIVGEYHLSKEHPRLWCCHCQGHRHHNGFVITNETGSNYMIGSKCGPEHYGLSFSFAQREHKAKVQRKGVLERLASICAAADAVNATIREILHSDGLRLIDQKREELKRASDSAFSALAVSVRTGSMLYEIVEVRDFEAERRRDDQLPPDKSGPPIYRGERMPIGRVAGTAVLREKDDCRDHLLSLKAAIETVVRMRNADTNKQSLQTLTKAVRVAEEAWDAAAESIIEAENAPAFFSRENLDRLERWTAENRYYRLTRDGIDLLVKNKDSAERRVTALQTTKLVRLPSVRSAAE